VIYSIKFFGRLGMPAWNLDSRGRPSSRLAELIFFPSEMASASVCRRGLRYPAIWSCGSGEADNNEENAKCGDSFLLSVRAVAGEPKPLGLGGLPKLSWFQQLQRVACSCDEPQVIESKGKTRTTCGQGQQSLL
jgi:hypothetical protein